MGVSSMNIYQDTISIFLGLKPIQEYDPKFDFNTVPMELSTETVSPFKGFKHTEEFKQYISGEGNGMYGKRHTAEARAKISQARKGKKRKPFSDETREKMRLNAKRRRKKTLPDGSWTWYYPS